MDNRSIGVFDSGLGGLTVLKQLKNIMPNESFVYLGDTARVPYGTRSKSTIVKFAQQDTSFLVEQDVKVIVIACNTASAYAYEELINSVETPVFDVITNTVRQAVDLSQKNNIAIIGTRGTINSNTYQKLIKLINSDISVIANACPLFVPLIEEGETSGDLITLTANKYLSPFINKDSDVLIMGCTHYPIISEVIKTVFKKEIILVDPGEATAKVIREYLISNELYSSAKKTDDTFYLTDITPGFREIAERFLGEKIESVNKVEIE